MHFLNELACVFSSPSPIHQPTAGHVLVHLLPCGLFRLSEVGRHFHRSSQNRPEPTPTSAAHSLNPSNDRPITQRLTPPLHPLPFEVWSLPLVTLSGRYCGLGTALQVSHYPPLTLACTGVPAPPGQPGPRSVPTRLQPLTAPTQKSGSNAEDLLAPWRREIRRICRGNLHARKSKSNLTKSEEIGDLSAQGSAP